MKFEHYQSLILRMFNQWDEDGAPMARQAEINPEQLPPLVLAYVGDAWFSLYVRTRLLHQEKNKVRVLHSYGAKMVSAVMQSRAVHALEPQLTEEELAIVRRGRNAKSSVPKSASVSEYRYSTGFEALLGYLFLTGRQERLAQITAEAFCIISRETAGEIL
ncbi:MAG TPA: ribonuclease III domain-containing protein [Patescibacteria group bacterium]|nr:ribonuclease III domain-containing protein [Patescibacteria group bacterium]